MNFAAVYLLNKLVYIPVAFAHHWYVDATRAFLHAYVSTLENLDGTFAVYVTLKHYLEPLYKDYSIVGRVLGIIFRSFRILIGGAVYFVVSAAFFVAYVVWAIVPVTLFFYAIRTIR